MWSRFLHRRSVRSLVRGGLRYVFGKRGQRRVHGWRTFYRLRVLSVLLADPHLLRFARRTEVRLWVDGVEAFPRLERLLSRARHTIVIQMFIWKDDVTGRRIASVLLEAANRGVQVDITKEAVGDVFEFHSDFFSTKQSVDVLWHAFWNHPNIRIHHVAQHDHTKAFVIDDQILLLTGMNIADEYSSTWHDYLVELRGSRFVAQYLTGGEFATRKRSRDSSEASESVHLVMNTENRREIRPVVTSLIHSARHSVLLEQCYLSDPQILDLLIRKSHEGVRVTLILPEEPDIHYHANLKAVGQLLVAGHPNFVQVFLYPGIVHGKVILVDRRRMFLGSANMVASSLDEMGEVSVLIEGRYLLVLRKLREVLRRDILACKPLSSPPHLRWIGRWLASMGL